MSKLVLLLSYVLLLQLIDCRKLRTISSTNVKEKPFQYEVSIQLGTAHCSGAIITDDGVITSAQCVVGVSPSNVSVGGTDLGPYKVNDIIIHDRFTLQYLFNNIALIKLQGSFDFNSGIRKIGLATREVPLGSTVVLSDWSNTSKPARPLDHPQHLNLTTINTKSCSTQYSGHLVRDKSICTTIPKEGCFFESGEPLVFEEKLVGIFSRCEEGKPAVFAKVLSYKDWINAEVES